MFRTVPTDIEPEAAWALGVRLAPEPRVVEHRRFHGASRLVAFDLPVQPGTGGWIAQEPVDAAWRAVADSLRELAVPVGRALTRDRCTVWFAGELRRVVRAIDVEVREVRAWNLFEAWQDADTGASAALELSRRARALGLDPSVERSIRYGLHGEDADALARARTVLDAHGTTELTRGKPGWTLTWRRCEALEPAVLVPTARDLARLAAREGLDVLPVDCPDAPPPRWDYRDRRAMEAMAAEGRPPLPEILSGTMVRVALEAWSRPGPLSSE